MLLDVVVEVIEGLYLVQLIDRDCNLVSHLYQCYQVHQVDAVQLKGVLQVGIGCKLTLFYFKLF